MKKILILTIFILLLFGFWQNVQAEQELIIDYPPVGGTDIDSKTDLPVLIKYIYLFSLGIVGFIALASIIVGAFQYTISAGNATKIEEAKQRITQAILGILILLSTTLILGTINPDLINLKLEKDPITVPIFSNNQPITGCQYTHATWTPTIINAGENAILTLYKRNCEGEGKIIIRHTLKQVAIASLGTGLGKDLLCGRIINQAWEKENIIEDTDTKFVQKFTFNKQCDEWIIKGLLGAPCKNLTFLSRPICNMLKKKPERFYLEAKILVPGQPTQYMGRVNITVIDNK